MGWLSTASSPNVRQAAVATVPWTTSGAPPAATVRCWLGIMVGRWRGRSLQIWVHVGLTHVRCGAAGRLAGGQAQLFPAFGRAPTSMGAVRVLSVRWVGGKPKGPCPNGQEHARTRRTREVVSGVGTGILQHETGHRVDVRGWHFVPDSYSVNCSQRVRYTPRATRVRGPRTRGHPLSGFNTLTTVM